MSEYFDIRDWDGNRTGKMKERELVHRDGDIHGTAHVWVIRSNKETCRPEVLLQKRSKEKDIFPGCFDVSAAGHLGAGEDFPEAAVRELKEELGLEIKPEELERLFLNQETVRRTFHGKKVYDREVSAVYVLIKDVPAESLRLQKEEVESVEWMDMEKCRELMDGRKELFCVHPGEYTRIMDYADKMLPHELSPTWNEDCLSELDEWIESQGIYIRQ